MKLRNHLKIGDLVKLKDGSVAKVTALYYEMVFTEEKGWVKKKDIIEIVEVYFLNNQTTEI